MLVRVHLPRFHIFLAIQGQVAAVHSNHPAAAEHQAAEDFIALANLPALRRGLSDNQKAFVRQAYSQNYKTTGQIIKYMNKLSDEGTLQLGIPRKQKLQNFMVDLQGKEAHNFAGNRI